MKHVFEPLPLLVAAILGALALYLASSFTNQGQQTTAPNYLLLGALTGLGVQIGVRATGVS